MHKSGALCIFCMILFPIVFLLCEIHARASSEEIELVVWTGDYSVYLKDQFEKEHPHVTVKLYDMGWDQDLYQNLLNAVRIGAVPDVVIGESYVQQLAAAGHLLSLDDAMAALKDTLIPGTYKGAEYQGNIYGVAAFTGIFGFERNCQVISAAGLACDKTPQTWVELLEYAKMITEKGNGEYFGYSLQGPVGPTTGSVFRISVYLNQAGASICRHNCTEPYFNNPKSAPVLAFLRQLNQYTPPGLTANPDEGQVYTPLFEGKSAYQIAGSWHPGWAREAGCEDCRYSPVPVPEGGHPANMVVGNVIFSALKQTKHPDLAVEWLKLVLRSDMQDLVYPQLGRLPSTRGALTRLRPKVDSATQVFIDELLHNPELNGLPQWRQEPLKVWKVYNTMLADVLSTERPLQEIMDEAQAAAEKILKK